MLDLGTLLIVGQQKFLTRAETFLREIIFLGGRNIMAEKGQVYKETSLRFLRCFSSSSTFKALGGEGTKLD